MAVVFQFLIPPRKHIKLGFELLAKWYLAVDRSISTMFLLNIVDNRVEFSIGKRQLVLNGCKIIRSNLFCSLEPIQYDIHFLFHFCQINNRILKWLMLWGLLNSHQSITLIPLIILVSIMILHYFFAFSRDLNAISFLIISILFSVVAVFKYRQIAFTWFLFIMMYDTIFLDGLIAIFFFYSHLRDKRLKSFDALISKLLLGGFVERDLYFHLFAISNFRKEKLIFHLNNILANDNNLTK